MLIISMYIAKKNIVKKISEFRDGLLSFLVF